jgi:meiotically up-regulated gene 157 (Mug157) protein
MERRKFIFNNTLLLGGLSMMPISRGIKDFIFQAKEFISNRKWFAWANSLFGELIIKVYNENRSILSQKIN